MYGLPMSVILVTGATGNVGKHVVSSLSRADAGVRALVRDPGKGARADLRGARRCQVRTYGT